MLEVNVIENGDNRLVVHESYPDIFTTFCPSLFTVNSSFRGEGLDESTGESREIEDPIFTWVILGSVY